MRVSPASPMFARDAARFFPGSAAVPRATDDAFRSGYLQALARLREIGVNDGVAGLETGTPMGAATDFEHASQAVFAERQRLEIEKYTFEPKVLERTAKINTERREHNTKLEKRAGEIADRLAKIEADPKRSAKNKAEARRELGKQIAEVRAAKLPEVDLTQLTARIDGIMNDPKLSEKEKKSRIQDIKETFDLSRGEMKALFTKRLGGIYSRSADRMEHAAKEHTAGMKQELLAAAKRFGVKSPEVAEIKARIDSIEGVYDAESQRTRRIGKTLNSMYPSFWQSLGKVFESIGKAIAKVVDFVMPVIKMIPGVGQIAGAVWGGVKAIGNFATGNWKAGISELAGAIPGVGGLAGKLIDVGKGVLQGALSGGPLGGLLGGAGAAFDQFKGALGSVFDAGKRAATGFVDRLTTSARGWFGGAVGKVMDFGSRAYAFVQSNVDRARSWLTAAPERWLGDLLK